MNRLGCCCHEYQDVKKEAQQFPYVIWVEQTHSPVSGSTPLEQIWFRIEVFSLRISVGMDNWNDPIVSGLKKLSNFCQESASHFPNQEKLALTFLPRPFR